MADKRKPASFTPRRRRAKWKYPAIGTPFQRRVWRELLRIPRGETRTYGEIARAIGKPGAARAVGMACNKNPFPIVVPCHRVIGASGKLTGYASGLALKRRLLELEKRPAVSDPHSAKPKIS